MQKPEILPAYLFLFMATPRTSATFSPYHPDNLHNNGTQAAYHHTEKHICHTPVMEVP